MKNKITIALLISGMTLATNASDDYLIIVDKSYHKYNVIENPLWAEHPSTYSEWVYSGDFQNCNQWIPTINEQESSFQQTALCDFKQTRIERITQINTVDGTFRVINTKNEIQFINKTNNRDIDILSHTPVVEQDNYNCDSWSPLTDTVYIGTGFEQERACDKDMMQEWVYSTDGSNLNSREERYTEQSGYETQNVSGTKSWDIIDSIYTEWAYTGTIENCSEWTPSIGQQQSSFDQSNTCDYTQTRTRNDLEYNSITEETNIINTEIESRQVNQSNTRNIIVSNNPIVEEQSNYNCDVWSPLSSGVYTGNDVNQERTCDVDMMKEWTYSIDGSQIATWEERTTERTDKLTQTVNGTHIENSCLNILNNGYSEGDGTYLISPDGNESFDVYCDMTTDGGGWTLFQSGTINNNTPDSDFTDYKKDHNDYINPEKFYKLNHIERNRINFKEFKTLHKGETGMYRNSVVLSDFVTSGSSIERLVEVDILSYKTSMSLNGNDDYNFQSNCSFTLAYLGHIDCLEGTESQNPWYQRDKVSAFADTTGTVYGVHTCTRFILNNGENLNTCSEILLSASLYENDCNNSALGDLHWQNKVTRPTCNYRSNPLSFYQWEEWVR